MSGRGADAVAVPAAGPEGRPADSPPARFAAATRESLLLRVLRRPQIAAELGGADWGVLLVQASGAALGGRLAALLEDAGVLDRVPARARDRLAAARRTADRYERITRWEVACTQRALRGATERIVLLKGAAYVIAGVPIGRGRIMSDVDILVARPDLPAVEAAVRVHGWRPVKSDPYDEHYYREYMHELPPLVHEERGTVLDIHHTIVPPTSRLKIAGADLLAAAEPIGGTGLWRLAPPDMLLHTAIHLFHDGEVFGGLRELVDLDGLIRLFGARPDFWPGVVDRAGHRGLGRPLFYALHYCRHFLETPVPDMVHARLATYAPPAPVRLLMDRLVAAAFAPVSPRPEDNGGAAARWLLYVRSHWLRMPPLLLARHLGRKALVRFAARTPKARSTRSGRGRGAPDRRRRGA